MTRLHITRHRATERMPRHRHAGAYAALVLAGGYVEAGDTGRVRVGAGQVIVHGPYEAHQDAFAEAGAVVLNVPLAHALVDGMWDELGVGPGAVADPDAVARLAERDPRAAAELLRSTFRPLPLSAPERFDDWPDRLAAALATQPATCVAEWARVMGLAPQSASRGFRRAYGASPRRYRAELRALRAAVALPGWRGSLSSLAADAGFADQSHLTRAVVALTGCTPDRLRRARHGGA